MIISKEVTERRRIFYSSRHSLRGQTEDDGGLSVLTRVGHIPSESHRHRQTWSFIAVLCVGYWTAVVTHHLLCCHPRFTLRQLAPSVSCRGSRLYTVGASGVQKMSVHQGVVQGFLCRHSWRFAAFSCVYSTFYSAQKERLGLCEEIQLSPENNNT